MSKYADQFFNQDAATIAACYDSMYDQERLKWHPIETAPKTGRVIEVNYGTAEKPEDVQLAFWSERPVCMGGPTVFIKPGWATAGDITDKNLPLDPPNFWREQ